MRVSISGRTVIRYRGSFAAATQRATMTIVTQIEANGITIEYERDGAGEPLLLIMGLGAQLTAWPPDLVEALVDRGFDVIRHDNRDIGLSSETDWHPPPPAKAFARRLVGRPVQAAYRLRDMADDAAGLLHALGLDSAHIAGASMGGMIAQSLAIHHPERVRSLTSIMSNPGNGSGAIAPKLALYMARRPVATRKNAVEISVETYRRISGPHFDETWYRKRAEASVERSFRPQGVSRQLAAILASPDRVPGLRRLSVPTLVIHGLVDPLVRPSGGVATARAVPGSRLLMFGDMGHDLPAVRLPEIAGVIAINAERAVSSRN